MDDAAARQALADAQSAPSLVTRPSSAEVLAGAASVALVAAAAPLAVATDAVREIRWVVAAAVWVVVLAWLTRRRPGARLRGRVDGVAFWACLAAALLPVGQLLWSPDSVGGAAVAGSVAALLLGTFLGVRWRR